MTPQHHIIKETSESLSRLLQDEFKRNGYKRVHIVEQAPKPDAILRQLVIDRYGGKDKAIGKGPTKKTAGSPGPLYKISKDMWQALALAIAYKEGARSG